MTKIKGTFSIEFVNNSVETVEVIALIKDLEGRILYLESDDGSIYNWINIISIRPYKRYERQLG